MTDINVTASETTISSSVTESPISVTVTPGAGISVSAVVNSQTVTVTETPITVTLTSPSTVAVAVTETPVTVTVAAGGVTDHAALSNLSYATSGHTGFQPAGSYLTSETDPVFAASAAAGIGSGDISNWNSKQAGAAILSAIAALADAAGVLTNDGVGGLSWAAAGGGAPFADSTAIVAGSVDPTKLLRFEVDGFTTATTRVITPPNADITLAGVNYANVFTTIQTISDAQLLISIPTAGNTGSIYPLEVLSTYSGVLDSNKDYRNGLHISSNTMADSGVYMGAPGTSEVHFSGGASYRNGSVNFIAKSTVAGGIYFENGQVHFWSNTSLTPGNQFTKTDRLFIDSGGLVNVASNGTNGTARFNVIGSSDITQFKVLGSAIQTLPPAYLIDNTAATAVVRNVLQLETQSTGTAAAGLGAGLLFSLETATASTMQSAGRVYAVTIDATNATRKYALVGSAYDTAEREGWRVEASGTEAKVSVYGAAPVVRASHIADATDAATAISQLNLLLAAIENFGILKTS